MSMTMFFFNLLIYLFFSYPLFMIHVYAIYNILCRLPPYIE